MQLARWWSLNNAENSSDFAFLGKMGWANREVDGPGAAAQGLQLLELPPGAVQPAAKLLRSRRRRRVWREFHLVVAMWLVVLLQKK